MKSKKEKENNKSYIMTKETLGMTIMLFSVLVFLMLLTRELVFAKIGVAVCAFMYGTFGYGAYIVLALLAYVGELLVFEKKIKVKPSVVISFALAIFSLFLVFHAVTTSSYSLSSFDSYISSCYNNAVKGFSGYTFGGVLCGVIVYPMSLFTTSIGTYVIFSILAVLFGYLTYLSIKSAPKSEKSTALPVKQTKVEEKIENREVEEATAPLEVKEETPIVAHEVKSEPIEEKPVENKYFNSDLGKKILFNNDEFAAESYRRNMIFNSNSYFNNPVHNDEDYLQSFGDGFKNRTPSNNETYSKAYSNEVEQNDQGFRKENFVYGDEPVVSLDDNGEIDISVSNGYSEMIKENDIDETYSESENIYENEEETPVEYDLDDSDDSYVSEEDEEDIVDEITPEEIKEEIEEENASADEQSRPRLGSIFSSSNSRIEDNIKIDNVRLPERREERSNANLFDDDNDDDVLSDENSSFVARSLRGAIDHSSTRSERIADDNGVNRNVRGNEINNLNDKKDEISKVETPKPNQTENGVVNEKERPFVAINVPSDPEKGLRPLAPTSSEQAEKPKHVWKKYVPPTLDLLDDYPENNNVNPSEIEENKRLIVDTLADYKIASHISNVIVGPTITRYDLVCENRTNIKAALKFKSDVAMSLMKDNINAYLNYTQGAISFEVPNAKQAVVGLKTMMSSSQFINSKSNSLTFALGKNVEGQVICPDITKMPHLLVAGTTGSGKSICLSSLIISLLYKYGPEELRFILVDPKQSEFIPFDKLPHLMINEIIYDVDKAIKALNWAIKEMEDRYSLFKKMTENGTVTKNLAEYNSHLPEGETKLPKIVIILDEFGDLMLQAKKDIESRIIRLVQKSRACGIHLILATQRPSVDCITGLIKSNLPTRIGFKVNSFEDSRTIFDNGGAEKLVGKGDMFFRSTEKPDLARIQGCFIDSPEVQRITDFIKKNNETYFDQSVSDFINTVEEPATGDMDEGDGLLNQDARIDEVYISALKYCVSNNQASVNMIQRRFPIGYMKACKIIDWMENMNYITQSEGSKSRKMLLSREECIKIYGEFND